MCMYADVTGLEEQSSTGLPKEGIEHAPAAKSDVVHTTTESFMTVTIDKPQEVLVAVQNSNGVETMEPTYLKTDDPNLDEELKRLKISGRFIQDKSGFVTPIENYEFNVFTCDGKDRVPSNVLVVARQGKPYPTIRVFDNPECKGEPMYVMTQEVFNHWGTSCMFALNRNDAYHTADGKELHLIMSMSGDVYFDDIMQK